MTALFTDLPAGFDSPRGLKLRMDSTSCMPEPVPPATSDDAALEQRVKNFLNTKHVPSLRHLDIKARGGVVTLKGRVQTFYEKQLCNQCCRRVAGVRQLVNAVDVIGDMPGAAVVA